MEILNLSKNLKRIALSEFLKAKRNRIRPESKGIPVGRRRTPGLRREEVAQLASVSTTWYTWLEQGRDINVSASVLDNIASALDLNIDEKDYLYALATDKEPLALGNSKNNSSLVSSSIAKIMKELKYCPTIVTDRYCNIVEWNNSATYVFLDFNEIFIEERNLIRLLFTRKELKALAVNWEHFANGFLSIFRAYYGEYFGDVWYSEFIDEMQTMSSDFRELWQNNYVSKGPDMIIEFRHSRAGKMQFQLTSLQVQGAEDLRLSIYTPVEDTDTEDKLKSLVE
jgi:transcriptional regulator with XRE-family HTH domain